MRVFALVALLWLMLVGPAWADTIVPTTFADPPGAGACPDDPCSLRQAAARSATDRIELQAGTYALTQSAPLALGHPLVVLGAQTDQTLIDGGRFEVTSAGVSIQNLTVTRSVGAGILMRSGSLDVNRLDISNHSGGGLRVEGGTVSVDRSTIRNNGATGVYVVTGQLAITDTTVAGHTPQGGAFGSGVVNQAGDVTLINATLVGNAHGGLRTDVGADTTVENTILGASPIQDGTNGSCVSPGQTTPAGTTTGQAVTNDRGHKIGEDTTCPLPDPSNYFLASAKLAPLHNNGGFMPSAAPLFGSPAINHGSAACSPLDQRGVAREGTCDIGAIEAVRIALPQFQFAEVVAITPFSAVVDATFTLSGEAGQVFVRWGRSPSGLINETAPVAAFGSQNNRALGIQGLDPGTLYYFQVVVQNATGEWLAPVASFNSASNTPQVNQTNADPVTDTTAKINFSLDPSGAATTYHVEWDNGSGHSGRTPDRGVPGSSDPLAYSETLTDLHPNTLYTVRVVAINANGTSSPDGATVNVPTKRQLTGVPGGHLDVRDEGYSNECPVSAQADWGDGQTEELDEIQCSPNPNGGWDFALEAEHHYEADGHYRITLEYATGETSELYALIVGEPAPQRAGLTVTATGPGRVSAQGIECPGTCSTTYPQGTQVTLTAVARPDARFGGWSGACAGAETTCTVTVGSTDVAVTATFETVPVVQPQPSPAPTPIVTPPAQTPQPVFGQSVVVEPSGTVLYKPKGSNKFVPLKAGTIPFGAQIDVTKGRITITSVPKAGGVPEKATFYDGIFTITQSGGITDLKLSGPEPTCKQKAGASAGKKVKSRKLWGDGKGAFRTTGKYSAATVRGTRWLVEDTCSGTKTTVKVGVVLVRDKVSGKSITLRAGKSYVAKPKRRR